MSTSFEVSENGLARGPQADEPNNAIRPRGRCNPERSRPISTGYDEHSEHESNPALEESNTHLTTSSNEGRAEKRRKRADAEY